MELAKKYFQNISKLVFFRVLNINAIYIKTML